LTGNDAGNGGASERSFVAPPNRWHQAEGRRPQRLRHESFTVDAIEGDVVTVKTGDGQETSIREGGDCPYGAGAIG
jgi:hypothetical protein